MNNEIIEKMKKIVEEYVEQMPETFNEETKLRTDLGLSSFELVSMISDAEATFGISFPDEDIKDLMTIGDMVKYIESKQTANV